MQIAILSQSLVSIRIIVWAFFIGLSVAIFLAYFNKSVLGKAVRSIIEKNALSEERAMTLAELDIDKNPFIKHSIEKGVLKRYIKKTDKDKPLAKYYIAENDRIQAELRYSNKGTDLFVVIISLIILLMVAFVLAEYLPELLSLAGIDI